MTNPVTNYAEDGLAAFEAGDYPAAVETLTKAIRLSLGNVAELLLLRGEAYAYLGQYEPAMADFNAALAKNAYYADAFNARGALFRLQEDPQSAVADFSAAVTLDPQHHEAYYNRALAYEDMGMLEEAEADLTASLEINPTLPVIYEARGRVRAGLGEYDGAIDDFSRYLRMGGGRLYDNHSETQSYILTLRVTRFFARLTRRY